MLRNIGLMSLMFFILGYSVAESITKNQYDKTIDLIQKSDFDSARVQLLEYENEKPIDPEYYALSLNYYFALADQDFVRVEKDKPTDGKPYVAFTDSSGKTAGYIYGDDQYNIDTLMKGAEIMKDGLSKFPNRLDMYFGLVYVFESAGLYKDMTSVLINILKHDIENIHVWLWSFNEPLNDDPMEFIRENVQTRVVKLFNNQDELSDSLIEVLSKQLIINYPNSTYGHSNLGLISLNQNDVESAYGHFLNALYIDSSDAIVLANLGLISEETMQIEEAVGYYRLLLNLNNPQFVEFAKSRLKALEK